jgi:hypothetical protein
MVDMSMTSDKDAVSERGTVIPAGTTVEYLGHVVGGWVRVRLPDRTEEVVHPRCFKQLR